MSKIILTVILAALAGAGCYVFFGQAILSTIPQLSGITSQIPNVINYVKENLAALGITVGTVITLGALGVGQLWKKAKTNIQQAATQKVSDAQYQTTRQVTEVEQKLSVVTTKNEQLEQQIADLQQANQNVAALQQKIMDLEKDNQRLANEKNEAERLVAALIPKEEKPKVH